MRGVYLLHFDRAFGHALHYLGFADNVAERLDRHTAGRGARLTQVVRAAGISWTLARTWDGATRAEERRLKQRGGRRRLCPLCKSGPRPVTTRVHVPDLMPIGIADPADDGEIF